MPRRGFEIARTSTPSASSWATTSFQPELSANAPWTSATVGPEPVASVMVDFLRSRGRLSSGRSRAGTDQAELAGGCASAGGIQDPAPRRSLIQASEQIGVEVLLEGAP